MTTITLPKLTPWQDRVRCHPARFKICACGRRAGKTKLGVALCLETALSRDIAWWVGPDYPTASIGWRAFLQLAAQIPGADIQRGDRIVAFPGGGWMQVRSAWEPDALRGEGLKRVVIDEAALIQEAAWTQALRPALADKRGDAFFGFSPKGRNWTHRLYLRGQDPNEPEYASWNLPSAENPYLDRAEIEQARRDMPDRWFRQEFLAEFLDDSGGVFRHVRAAIRARKTSGPVFVGVDLGRTLDATVFMAVQDSHVIGFDRFTDTGWELQFGRLKAFCARHNPALVLIETNFNDMFAEQAARELPYAVQGFRTSEQSKRDIIDALALAIEQGIVSYPEIPQLQNELEAFEFVQREGGKVRFSAPAGYHDDCVIALALAHWAQTRIGVVGGSFADLRGRAPASIMRGGRR